MEAPRDRQVKGVHPPKGPVHGFLRPAPREDIIADCVLLRGSGALRVIRALRVLAVLGNILGHVLRRELAYHVPRVR